MLSICDAAGLHDSLLLLGAGAMISLLTLLLVNDAEGKYGAGYLLRGNYLKDSFCVPLWLL